MHVYTVHQFSASQSDTQRPADWAQAPDAFKCLAASAGDSAAKSSAPISAPAATIVMIDLIRMAQPPNTRDQTNVS